MNILYYLQNLPNGPEKGHRTGRVRARGSLDERSILDRMVSRGTGIGRGDMLAILELFTQEIADALADGWAVNTRLARYRPDIKGLFTSTTDPFDRRRHHFRAVLSEGQELKRIMREATGERINVPAPVPHLIQYMDHGSHMPDGPLTPGGTGELTGQGLKYDGANAMEGLFLIHEADSEFIKIRSVSVVTEGRLVFKVPSHLAPGEYILCMRRSYANGANLRAGRLHTTLTVG